MQVRPIVALLPLALAATAAADEVTFLSAKIAETPGFIGSAVFGEDGSLLYSVQNPITNTQDVVYNGVNISADLLGADRFALAAGIYDGLPAWWGYGQLTGGDNRSRVFLNTTDVSGTWVPDLEWARAAAASPAGIAWYCKRSGSTNLDTYRNAQLLSGFLGATRNTLPTDINDLGQVVWHGFGSSTGGNRDVYVDSTNFTASILTGTRLATSVAINNRGTIIWFGRGDNTSKKEHAFVNATDISAPLVGANTVARSVLLNENDQVAWVAYLTNGEGISDVWLGDRNVSAAILGLDREAWPLALNDAGDLLWFGSGRNLDAVQDIFVNDFNLSRSVLGPNRPASSGVTMNNRGWVLWQTPNALQRVDTTVSMPCNRPVSGTVALSQYVGNLANVQLTFHVREANQGWDMGAVNAYPNASGQFSVMLPDGVFDVTVSAPTFLQKRIASLDTSGSGVEGLYVSLLGGDADGDNDVDFSDIAKVMYFFGKQTSDLNGDGVMDLHDMNLVLTNLGLHGD
ncbi:MAG: hypothetical protein HRF45_03585 [Fimbriimonadia bacterium]|jgi:hypothetical protein